MVGNSLSRSNSAGVFSEVARPKERRIRPRIFNLTLFISQYPLPPAEIAYCSYGQSHLERGKSVPVYAALTCVPLSKTLPPPVAFRLSLPCTTAPDGIAPSLVPFFSIFIFQGNERNRKLISQRR